MMEGLVPLDFGDSAIFGGAKGRVNYVLLLLIDGSSGGRGGSVAGGEEAAERIWGGRASNATGTSARFQRGHRSLRRREGGEPGHEVESHGAEIGFAKRKAVLGSCTKPGREGGRGGGQHGEGCILIQGQRSATTRVRIRGPATHQRGAGKSKASKDLSRNRQVLLEVGGGDIYHFHRPSPGLSRGTGACARRGLQAAAAIESGQGGGAQP